MNEKLGFKVIQILLEAEDTDELNECMRVVNNTYPILHQHLAVIEENKHL